MAVREDKTVRVERIIGRTTGFINKTKHPDTYEFSIAKYTRSGNLASNYVSRQVTAEEYTVLANGQSSRPVLVLAYEGRQWWWYWSRFWKDDDNLTAPDVQALLVQRERTRQSKLERARASVFGSEDAATDGFDERAQKRRLTEERAAAVEQQNADLEASVAELEALLTTGLEHYARPDEDIADEAPEALASYFAAVLEQSPYPRGFPKRHRVAFVPESRQLVVEFELPPVSIVPTVRAYRHVRTRNAVEETARPVAQVRSLYAQVVSQCALRTLHEIFQADNGDRLETVVLNCFVDTIDPATGQPARPHLVTVRTSKDQFQALNLRQVDPLSCLRGLRAEVSRSPHELLPVRPIVQFDMVDSRFVEDSDVLGALDTRPNLMQLTPKEFEGLISNLFEKMGLDTRLTQASRDGGVDCVAWDHRPIFGGKVIIQAKRYKNTVGVSAVRDLFGTMQNEGASKGILVTTSGYGKSSYEFADGKPLELLTGSHLLHLLSEHADIEARIEVPEDWVDPTPDEGSDEPQIEPPSGAPVD